MNTSTSVSVVNIEPVSPEIKEFTLRSTDSNLYPFSPGSHIVVDVPLEGRILKNAYSLLSDPVNTSEYKIAVRRQSNSRGGSMYMHEQLKVGDCLTISAPANMFAPDWKAKKHILIAGGVGITPFMSYLTEFDRRGVEFELHYLYRSEYSGAYVEVLRDKLKERLYCYDSGSGQSCNVQALLADRKLGTHFYVCGPDSLLQDIKEQVSLMGIPDSALHYEAFASPQPGKPFEVLLKEQNKRVSVSSEQSMLEALEAADVYVPNLCRGGVCGQCVCKVVDGEIEHRDDFLSDTEKQLGQTIMPCVSRAKFDRLTLDL